MNRKNRDRLIIAGAIGLILLFSFWKDKQKQAAFEPSGLSLVAEPLETATEEESMMVHITGAVHQPGIVEIQKGDRLQDVIKASGGLTSDADEGAINLAMRVEDEMRIAIPSKNPETLQENAHPAPVIQGPSDGLMNLNKATKDELMTLPGIGEKRATDIITYREKQPFQKPEDLMEVSGIGQKTFESLKPLISAP